MSNTGFDLHVALSVDFDGERPNPKYRTVARNNLRSCAQWKGGKLGELSERWFDVTGQGYEKNYLWVIGGTWKVKPATNAPKLVDEMTPQSRENVGR